MGAASGGLQSGDGCLIVMPRMSQAEFNAYEARRMSATGQRIKQGVSDCLEESDLHEKIFAECRRRGWIALHGAMSERTHRTAGEPDFTIITDIRICNFCERPRIILVEAKTKAGKLSTAQASMHAHAAKLGHTIHVVRSFEEFLKLL